MMMFVCTAIRRHAIPDCFKGIVNRIDHKDQIFLVVPGCYDLNEFSEDFSCVEQAQFFKEGKIGSKVKAVQFALHLRKIVKENGIGKLFLFAEKEWFNVFLYFALIGIKKDWFLFVHDPVIHTGESRFIKMVDVLVAKLIGKKAKKLFVTYHKGKDELLSKNPELSPSDIEVVYLPRMEEMEFDDLRDNSGDDNEEYDGIFFGRVEVYKGIDILLESIVFIKEKTGIRINLLIVGGNGTQKDLIRKYAVSNDNIHYVDRYVSSRELATYISKSRLVILPYRDATGTQTVQIANYYKKPVITSTTGCFEEYVKDGINGIRIEDLNCENLAKAIIELLNDKSLVDKMKSEMGSVLADYFDTGHIASQIMGWIGEGEI